MDKAKLKGLIGAPFFLAFLGLIAYYVDPAVALLIFLAGLFVQHRRFQKRK